MNITTGDGDRLLSAYNTDGSLSAMLGNGDDIVSLEKTEGDVLITSGVGFHNCTFDETGRGCCRHSWPCLYILPFV